MVLELTVWINLIQTTSMNLRSKSMLPEHWQFKWVVQLVCTQHPQPRNDFKMQLWTEYYTKCNVVALKGPIFSIWICNTYVQKWEFRIPLPRILPSTNQSISMNFTKFKGEVVVSYSDESGTYSSFSFKVIMIKENVYFLYKAISLMPYYTDLSGCTQHQHP